MVLIADIQWTLMEAYRELSYTKPRSSIRVKELCSAANMARSTFFLEMVAAEAIAGYTFWLSHPYETNEADIKRLLVYTLGMLE